jgi:hypothetical protein
MSPLCEAGENMRRISAPTAMLARGVLEMGETPPRGDLPSGGVEGDKVRRRLSERGFRRSSHGDTRDSLRPGSVRARLGEARRGSAGTGGGT